MNWITFALWFAAQNWGPCGTMQDPAYVYDLDECTCIERVGFSEPETFYAARKCWSDGLDDDVDDGIPSECWPTKEDKNPCDL